MEITPEFKDRINELIKKKLTDMQCMKIFGISSKALYNARAYGKYPAPLVIAKMTDFFGVSQDYLLGLTDEKAKD